MRGHQRPRSTTLPPAAMHSEVPTADRRRSPAADRVPVPGAARHLQFADPGGPVLVPFKSADAG